MIHYDFSEHPDDAKAIHALLQKTYWAQHRPLSVVRAALTGSLVVYARTEQGELVGSARAVTDRATFAWICDVVVAGPYQGQGIGKALMQQLLEHPDVKSTRKVLVTKDAQELYKQFGFQTHPYECMICYEPGKPN